MKTPNMLKITAVMSLAGLMMGNTNCGGKAPVDQGRVLRRLVEVGKVSAQPIPLPNGQEFDLQFVINQQYPDVLVGSGQYAVINRDATGDLIGGGLTAKDSGLLSKMGVIAEKWYATKDAECLISLPQYKLNGVVNSYEWVSGGGIRVGYTPSGSNAVSNIGGSVHFDKAEMDLTLRAKNPIDGTVSRVANVTKNQIKTKVAFDISFGQFNIGPEFYYQKGLAKVTKEALELGLKALRAQTDQQPWQTRAGEVQDNFVTIVGGDDINLMPGDQVSFQNARYQWKQEDKVCDPAYYVGHVPGQIVAYGVVTDVGDHLSTVKIDQNTMLDDIVPGALVKLVKLVEIKPVPGKK